MHGTVPELHCVTEWRGPEFCMQHWLCDETPADVYHPLLIHFSKTLTRFKLIVLIALLHTHRFKSYECKRIRTSCLKQQE
jgi:hypothetical protein